MEPMQGKLASSQFDFGYTEQLCIPGVTSVFFSSCDSVVGDSLVFNQANRGSLPVWLGKRNCSGHNARESGLISQGGLFKNANLSMSSCKILLWFSIAFRIKSRFYKTFKTLHFLIKALFSAISGYLFFFDYITCPLASCLCLFHYVRLIIFFPEAPCLALILQVADLTAPNLE